MSVWQFHKRAGAHKDDAIANRVHENKDRTFRLRVHFTTKGLVPEGECIEDRAYASVTVITILQEFVHSADKL